MEKDLTIYVAFLRGINVGGRSQIRMEDLRKAFESSGFTGRQAPKTGQSMKNRLYPLISSGKRPALPIRRERKAYYPIA